MTAIQIHVSHNGINILGRNGLTKVNIFITLDKFGSVNCGVGLRQICQHNRWGTLCQHNRLISDQYSLIEQSVHKNYTVLNSLIHSNRASRMH